MVHVIHLGRESSVWSRNTVSPGSQIEHEASADNTLHVIFFTFKFQIIGIFLRAHNLRFVESCCLWVASKDLSSYCKGGRTTSSFWDRYQISSNGLVLVKFSLVVWVVVLNLIRYPGDTELEQVKGNA